MIVCYLHGQTGRFTFWEIANKSGLLRPISQKRQRKPQRAKTVVSPRSSPLKTFPQRRGARRNGCFRSYVASIYANLFHKRKRLHNKRVQLPQEWFGTLTWPPGS